ncbi:hypothetical protein CC85DRAFT_311019 [Cutaneotrichosporon oleaginosum]|uniref:Uncharacterized protein n=1 Tax=Cutaneotrichosporon oleaginosum TaxID=879819 RepID=A0A0J0XUH7_9TREE|nr:uncharacterized protein CC85DRAFT_311019 [Cutaneotrichosporon oleaginosum]KLT44733.1 hypothetical protein CC85DRAFT_311019 [Cutaneotrichosporon oleaginosum]TXT07719.1 hypothetical protein COLE_04643 [Cutaneotrichosporon oleaginosum]
MASYLMTPPTVPRKRSRQSANASFEPLLATPELVKSPSNASFESAEPCTPRSQRFTPLPPPTPRFTRTQTPQTKAVVPPSPSPAARFRKAYLDSASASDPITPPKMHILAVAPPATPLHQQRRALTPHSPSPVTAAPSALASAPSSDDLPFRVRPFARASVQRASAALQDLMFDADPFLDMDMDVDEAFGPVFTTPKKAAHTPEPELPCTPPRQVRRGLPRSPRHWNLASAVRA